MKFLAVSVVLALSYSALADEAGTTSGQVSTAEPAKPKAVTFRMVNDLNMGTVVTQGSLQSGQRYNYTSWRPELRADTKTGLLTAFSVPFAWVTSGSSDQNRVIGRPEFSVYQVLAYSDGLVLSAGVGVRLPFADSSFGTNEMGSTELLRRWRITPGAKLDARLGQSPYHLVSTAYVLFDTPSEAVQQTLFGMPATVTVFMNPAPTASATVGVTRRWNTFEVGAAFSEINQIGIGHQTLRTAVPAMGTQEDRTDLTGIDYLAATAFTRVSVAEDTSLLVNVTKSLKSNGIIPQTVVAAAETLPEFTNLGIGANLVKSF